LLLIDINLPKQAAPGHFLVGMLAEMILINPFLCVSLLPPKAFLFFTLIYTQLILIMFGLCAPSNPLSYSATANRRNQQETSHRGFGNSA
jgi:hypothetical protein